jgi:hypothetical protein
MDKKWYEKLKARGLTADSVYQDGRYEGLKKKILTGGGDAVIFLGDTFIEEYKELEEKGFFKEGDGAIKVSGIAGKCHDNVEPYLRKNKELWHMYGFALSDDGVWREHSWLMHGTKEYILETTELRTKYYGIRLT